NKINADKNRRGIDLEEADGIQDIGEEFQTIFGDIIIAEGEENDLWFAENQSEFYTNQFNGSTKPNTNSNEEARSLVSFSNFSNISNRMTFDVSFGSDNIELIKTKSFNSAANAEELKLLSSNSNFGYFLSGNDLYLIDSTFLTKRIFEEFSNNDFTIQEKGNTSFVFGAFENELNVSYVENNIINVQSADLESNINSPIVSIQKNNEIKIYVGLENGRLAVYSFDAITKEVPTLVSTFDVITSPSTQIAIENEKVYAIHKDRYTDVQNGTVPLSEEPKKLVLTNDKNAEVLSIVLSEKNNFYVIQDGKIQNEFDYSTENIIDDFSIADLKQDGENYILFYSEKELNAVNLNGSMAENFPIVNNNITNFVATPLAADINNDNYTDILCTSDEGVIFAYSGLDGKLLNNFPISTGDKFVGYQSIVKRENDLLFSTITENNEFYFWSIKSDGDVDWGGKFGNNQNSSFLKSASGTQSISDFFPQDRTYNWPNPVYEDVTYIRTYVAEDSK
ncbi:MAG: hypothetical protein GY936_10705, partial [Ignavibacteriae bacterium]|nr:hypothetical protein [Ignavibacteriota bacterium]